MMKNLSFEVDEEFDAQFPQKRFCRAEIYTLDNQVYKSPACEPRGEAHENIGYDWLCDKFLRITSPVITVDAQEKIIKLVKSNDISVRELVDFINSSDNWKM